MKRNSLILASRLVLLTASLGMVLGQGGEVPPQVLHYADLVVTNGIIYAADENFSMSQAMALRDGKVLALGDSDTIARMAGPNTQRIDLQGRSVVPGLFDTHLHQPFIGNGFTLAIEHTGNLPFVTIEQGLQQVKELVQGVPAGEWVVARGPFNGNDAVNNVTRWQLDTVSPDHPLAIIYAGELSVVNTRALELSKLSLETPGVLKNDEGEATGQLRTWAHGAFTYEILPWPEITDELLDRQEEELAKYVREGITTIIGRGSGLQLTLFRELWERDALPARIRIGHEFIRSNPNAESLLKRMGKLVSFGLDDMVKIVGASLQHPDGTSGSGGMLTWQRKLRRVQGDPYGEFGLNRWEEGNPEENDQHNVKLAARYGWNVNTTHNQGDRATWLFLKAIEEGHKEVLVKPSLPFGVDHQLFMTQDNIDLMKRYNVIPSMGSKYVFGPTPESLIYQYGPDAVHRMTAVQTLISAGLRPVSESDTREYPLYKPLWSIERFITREDDSGKVWGADEAVSRKEALWMRTLWAARYSGDEEILGSLEPGKLADFVVLAGDFMKVPADQLSELGIDYVFIGSKLVYENQGEADLSQDDRDGM